MHKFRKAGRYTFDLDKIYNCTRRSEEEALEIGLQTEYNPPPSHGISCSCCRLDNQSTTYPTTEEKVRSKSPSTTHHIDRRNF